MVRMLDRELVECECVCGGCPLNIVLCIGCDKSGGAVFQDVIDGSLLHGYCADCLAKRRRAEEGEGE